MSHEQEIAALLELARLYGVQASYHDMTGRLVEATPETLLAVVAALGGPFEGMAEVPEALAARRAELDTRLVEPVLVAWDGELPEVWLRLPAGGVGDVGAFVACHLDLENGERRAWTHDLERLPAGAGAPGLRRMPFPESLPLGYHQLEVKTGGRTARSTVIAAPRRAWGGGGVGDPGAPDAPRAPGGNRLWGVFLPLYALRTAGSWGSGDLSDLGALAEWTARLGGGVVATLPMLAAFLDEPYEASPYAPVSRQFWNEVYLDPRHLPEATLCPAARRLLESAELQAETRVLAELPLVDYRRLATLKRRVVEEMVAWFFVNGGARRQALERFVAARPELADYAAFRAVGDRRGESWQQWPERLREGSLAAADYDEEDFRYHLWVQWAMEEQMGEAASQARRHGPGLYLDLPVGVHPSSYDVWRERDVFAPGLAAGAPPDSFFTRGQNWGFPPLAPQRLRERGYDHLIAALRHHLRHAGVLRIDHVMQLHRLFCIPAGMPASAGAYVRYHDEELYAVLTLESHRHGTMIVGENLGTVPPEVDEAMQKHGLLGMYVTQYELAPGGGDLRQPPAATVAALNTHDMPTFRGFWEGRDVEDLRRLGFFDEAQARAELERRGGQRHQMVGAAAARHPGEWDGHGDPYPLVLRDRLEQLAASPARMMLVNLEDLWQETEPQNLPGTTEERPNWRRKARLSLEEMERRPEVSAMLQRVDELRRKGDA